MPRLPIFLAAHPALDIDVVLQDGDIDLIGAGIDVALRMSPLRIAKESDHGLREGVCVPRRGVRDSVVRKDTCKRSRPGCRDRNTQLRVLRNLGRKGEFREDIAAQRREAATSVGDQRRNAA